MDREILNGNIVGTAVVGSVGFAIVGGSLAARRAVEGVSDCNAYWVS